MTVQLVYETHAITTDNEAGRATGWLPGVLSARGRETAAELGRRRRDDGLAVIYVSDLARAVETVRIAFDQSAIPVIAEDRLRECNYGTLNGMPGNLLERERSQHVHDPWPGGESYDAVVQRTRRLLQEVVERWDGSRVLMVGHSANKWALDHLLLGEDLFELVSAGLDWQEGWEYGRSDRLERHSAGRRGWAVQPLMTGAGRRLRLGATGSRGCCRMVQPHE